MTRGRTDIKPAIVFVLLLVFIALPSQSLSTACAQPSKNSDDENIYRDKIVPIFRAKCFRCHGIKTQKADLDLSSPKTILKGGESGDVIDREDLVESLLYEYVSNGSMPPENEGKLTAKEIETICRWISSGAEFGSQLEVAKLKITQHEALFVLRLRCTVCHGLRSKEAGLDLSSRASILRGGKSGPAMMPGKPQQSLLLQKIHTGAMPPKRRLAAASVKPVRPGELEVLTQWIAAGAPLVEIAADVATTKADPLVSDEDRKFWSFQPPRAAAPPNVKAQHRLRNPIDAFILARLEQKGLTLSPQAERQVLIRRAYFDLIGLPPSPEAVDTFVTDNDPHAYEKLIDRLLASPRYGERWGRRWLDLAGYADSEGVQNSDLVRPHAYRYRDYVIRALNTDKPYDRFLHEQLAGDELADYEKAKEITPEIYDNLVATGFLRMTPDGSTAPITNFVPDRLEQIDDELEVFSSTVLGLTIKCARCHSHKFDPLPMRDYYRLTAIFKGAYDEHDWLVTMRKSEPPGVKDRYLPIAAGDERKAWQAAGGDKKKQPLIRALWDRGSPSPTYMLRRGNYLTPGRLVGPGVPSVLTDGKTPFQVRPPWPGAKQTGRRLALARWLTEPEHPLTARVMANRIWKHHFGRGIVETLDNFGRAGARPSHPQMLDWLAVEFVRSDWSIKEMHRLMMTSAAYRQSSRVATQHQQLDPDNALFSRMPLRRLEGEILRDSLLAAAGRLDLRQFGPADGITARSDGLITSNNTHGAWRRSIYVQQRRTQIPTLLENFDLPQMNPNCIQRTESIVAPQALHLLNNKTIHDLADAMADRVLQEAGADPSRQIELAYRLALGRRPKTDEMEKLQTALKRLEEGWLKRVSGTRHELVATSHLWIRESSPDTLYEDDLISVWSRAAGDKARRWGLVEFDLRALRSLKISKAHLELGALDTQALKQHAAAIPIGIEGITWNGFHKRKSPHLVSLTSLGRFSLKAGEGQVGRYVAGQSASAAELKLLASCAAVEGKLALVLMAEEDGTSYRRDWDDGVYKTTRHKPPRLVVFDSTPNPVEARRRALRNVCHAILNSAAFLYID